METSNTRLRIGKSKVGIRKPEEVAKLIILMVERESKRKGTKLSRFLISIYTLRALFGHRIGLGNKLIKTTADDMIEYGWVLFEIDKNTYGVIKLDSTNWVRLGPGILFPDGLELVTQEQMDDILAEFGNRETVEPQEDSVEEKT